MDRLITVNDLTDDEEYANAKYKHGEPIALDHLKIADGYARTQMWMVNGISHDGETLYVFPFSEFEEFTEHNCPIELVMGKVSYRCLKEYEEFYGFHPWMYDIFGEDLKRESKEAWINELY